MWDETLEFSALALLMLPWCRVRSPLNRFYWHVLGRQSLDSLARRLLQAENSQAWKQLCDPVPGQMAVGRKVGLHGEIHGAAEEVWNVVPGESGLDMLERMQCGRNPPLGEQGEQCSCSCSGGDWLGGGQGPAARARAVPQGCLCWITPPFPRERLSKSGFIRA